MNDNKLWRVGSREIELVAEAINNGLTGEFNRRFEEEFAALYGCGYAISVNSGTSALHACMLALGISYGDEVIVPPLTFVATGFSPLYVGAKPVFADVCPKTFLIKPKEVEKKITSRTKAIIVVSLFGLSPEYQRLKEIADKHNLYLIEDNAQCVLGEYDGNLVGRFGHLSTFSLQRSKHLTTGDGGVIITDDPELALRCRRAADLGYTTLQAKNTEDKNRKEKIQQPDFKRHAIVGFNLRMPEVCAAMGLAQIEKVHDLIKLRQAIGWLYEDVVNNCNWLRAQWTPPKVTHTYWAFGMILLTDNPEDDWKAFRAIFVGLGGSPFYGCWSLSYEEPSFVKLLEDSLPDVRQSCPSANYLQPRLIQLKTNFPSLEEGKRQADILAMTIRRFEEERGM